LYRLAIPGLKSCLAVQSAALERLQLQAKCGKYEEYSSSLLQQLAS
jgi:hypothetical protein